MTKEKKKVSYRTLCKRFSDYAYNNFGRLETRIPLCNLAKWLDWRKENPRREFWRFERFL